MIALFACVELVVRTDATDGLGGARTGVIVDGDDTVVATLRDRAGPLRRTWGTLSSIMKYVPEEWDVLDPAGRQVLTIDRNVGLSGPRPEVSLADGTGLGRAVTVSPEHVVIVSRHPGPSVRLLGTDDALRGELVPAVGEGIEGAGLQFRIRDTDGSVVGEVAVATGGNVAYRLSFEPEASLVVRALTVGYAVASLA